jgi:hypothetical protein
VIDGELEAYMRGYDDALKKTSFANVDAAADLFDSPSGPSPVGGPPNGSIETSALLRHSADEATGVDVGGWWNDDDVNVDANTLDECNYVEGVFNAFDVVREAFASHPDVPLTREHILDDIDYIIAKARAEIDSDGAA